MRRALRYLLWSLAGILALAGVLGALLGYLIYSPRADAPHLTGTLTHGTISVAGRIRTYLVYAPQGLGKGAPLVVAMHGSGETTAAAEMQTPDASPFLG